MRPAASLLAAFLDDDRAYDVVLPDASEDVQPLRHLPEHGVTGYARISLMLERIDRYLIKKRIGVPAYYRIRC